MRQRLRPVMTALIVGLVIGFIIGKIVPFWLIVIVAAALAVIFFTLNHRSAKTAA